MTAPEKFSGVDQIYSLLNGISTRLVGLPGALRDQIENDLQHIRACVAGGAQPVSDDSYRELAESINDGFLELDRDWRFTYVNQRAASNVGCTPTDLVGKNMWELFPRLLGTPAERVYRQAMDKRQPASFETAGTITDQWYSLRVYPSARGITIFWIDISERKQAEAELRANSEALEKALIEIENEKNRLLAVMEALPIGLSIYDKNGADVIANRGYEEIWGNARPPVHSLEDYPLYRAWWADSGQPVQPEEWASTQAFQKGKTITGQVIEIQGFDGKHRTVLNSGAPVLDAQGQVTGAAVAIMDITGMKQMEQALAASEHKYRKLIQYAPAAIYEIDFRTGLFTAVNDSMVELSGYSREELLQMRGIDLLDEEGKALFQERIRQWLAGEKPDENVVYRVRMKDGRILYVVLNSTFTKDENGRPLGATVIAHDITERKQAEEALRRKERELSEAQRLTHVGSWYWDSITDVTTGSDELLRIYGFDPVTQSMPNFRDQKGRLYPAEVWEGLNAAVQSTLQTGVGYALDIQALRNGNPIWVTTRGEAVQDADGKIIALRGTVQDITERKRAEAAEREHLVQMEIQRKLLIYRDQERQALARELHDGPVQDLSSLLFNVQFAKEAISDLSIQLELEKITAGIRTSVQNMRQMINEMRPPSLIRFGLAKALNVFLEDYCEKHPEIAFNVSLTNDENSLSEPARLSLFRIIQEALANAVKHSQAARIDVSLLCEEDTVVLELHDDGNGFELSENLIDYSTNGHFGLVGMKERADAIGAALQVCSSPGNGTIIKVIVPLNNR